MQPIEGSTFPYNGCVFPLIAAFLGLLYMHFYFKSFIILGLLLMAHHQVRWPSLDQLSVNGYFLELLGNCEESLIQQLHGHISYHRDKIKTFHYQASQHGKKNKDKEKKKEKLPVSNTLIGLTQ